MTINIELKNLYLKDKAERAKIKENTKHSKLLEIHTSERLKKLKQILQTIDKSEIWNCHYIAYLLQHGNSTDDYKLAHDYAKKAVNMGSNVTKWLYAATLDRWLVSQGKKQKFGTQFKNINGKWVLSPIDGSLSDEQRKEYGVPPLAKAHKVFTKKYK